MDFSKAIELKPGYDEAYSNRGAAYLSKGKIDQAIADFSKAVELNPNYDEAYSNRGAAYMAKGQLDRAVDDYSKAIELNPKDTSAYYNMACLQSVRKNVQESCAWLQKAVDKGYDKWEHMKNDPDLKNVREAACYKKIMEGK